MLLVAAGFGAALVGQRYWAPEPDPIVGSAADVRLAELWATQLPDLHQHIQPLKQWQGKVLVVNFWAPWCPPCRQEIPVFIRMQDRLGKQGVQFVGIALDETDKVAAFVQQSKINYPILLGSAQAATLSYSTGNHSGGLPFTILFDRQGNAIATLTGSVSEARLETLLKPLL